MLPSHQKPRGHSNCSSDPSSAASIAHVPQLSELDRQEIVPSTTQPESQQFGSITRSKVAKLNAGGLVGIDTAAGQGTQEAAHTPRRSSRLAAQNRRTSVGTCAPVARSSPRDAGLPTAEVSLAPKQQVADENEKPQPPGGADGGEPRRRIPQMISAFAARLNSKLQPLIVPAQRVWHQIVSPLALRLYSRTMPVMLSAPRMSQQTVPAPRSNRYRRAVIFVFLSVYLYRLTQRWPLPDPPPPPPQPPARINATLSFSPGCRREILNLRIMPVLEDCRAPARILMHLLLSHKFSPTNERSYRALEDVYEACSYLARDYKRASCYLDMLVGHANSEVSQLKSCRRKEFEEHVWGPYAEDDGDGSQYDDLELVGDVNRHEAVVLNRSAALFITDLYSERLPELVNLRFLMGTSKIQDLRGILQEIKHDAEKLAEHVEYIISSHWVAAARSGVDPDNNILRAGRPGLMRRAVFLATRLPWEHRCLRRSSEPPKGDDDLDILSGTDAANADSEIRYFGYSRRAKFHPIYHDIPVLGPVLRMFEGILPPTYEYHYYASAWRCILDIRRIVETEVLPLVRQTQADASAALALLDTGVEAVWEKLHDQLEELSAGRGWEFVEIVQIGKTPDGHLVESSKAAAVPLEGLRNVTMWRRMFLPMGHVGLNLLDETIERLALGDLD
ncbi:hypothetical protein MFIFM68171_10253 [Madurella fahalii]|uniref:Uncharacterized protein n=1 Tax=Madurella fahalii TaxID=1157608 RepID=A0ABQ0GQM9_9PEZI